MGKCLGHEIKPDIGPDQRLDPGIRNADQDDGFGMLYDLDADNFGVIVYRYHCVNWLTGISGCSDKIRSDVNPADLLGSLQQRCDWQGILDRAESVRSFHYLVRLNFRQIFGECSAFGMGLTQECWSGNQEYQGGKQNE